MYGVDPYDEPCALYDKKVATPSISKEVPTYPLTEKETPETTQLVPSYEKLNRWFEESEKKKTEEEITILNVNDKYPEIQKLPYSFLTCLHRAVMARYGLSHQIGKLREECLEVIKAIDEWKNLPKDSYDERINKYGQIFQEVADVQNLIDQLRIYEEDTSYDDHFEDYRMYKMLRQMKRIVNEDFGDIE